MRIKRVGTITLGLSLIMTGLLSVFSLVTNFVDIFTVMKFAPIILVSLGIEILISNFVTGEEKLRIDGWAIFVSFILISATLLSTAAVTFIDRYKLIN